MTENMEIQDLIAWAKSLGDPDFTLSVPGHAKAAFRKMADALTAVSAELRQERERAEGHKAAFLVASSERFEAIKARDIFHDKAKVATYAMNEAQDDLARARAVIAEVREWWYSDDAPKVGHKAYHAMKSILATYDQKEQTMTDDVDRILPRISEHDDKERT